MSPAVASLFHVKNCKAGAARLISTMRDVIKFFFRTNSFFDPRLVPRTRTGACLAQVPSVVGTEFLESWASLAQHPKHTLTSETLSLSSLETKFPCIICIATTRVEELAAKFYPHSRLALVVLLARVCIG